MTQDTPQWTITDETVTITMTREQADSLAHLLNLWQAWTPWMEREDCRNWKRSPIARENKRESQTSANCLRDILSALGRRDMLTLMQSVKQQEE